MTVPGTAVGTGPVPGTDSAARCGNAPAARTVAHTDQETTALFPVGPDGSAGSRGGAGTDPGPAPGTGGEDGDGDGGADTGRSAVRTVRAGRRTAGGHRPEKSVHPPGKPRFPGGGGAREHPGDGVGGHHRAVGPLLPSHLWGKPLPCRGHPRGQARRRLNAPIGRGRAVRSGGGRTPEETL